MNVYEPNPVFPEEWERSLGAHIALTEAAIKIADAARNTAPEATGNYRNSIHGIVAFIDGHVEGVVVATDPAAGFIEFGTQFMPAFATLRRAAEREGFVVRHGGRGNL